MGPYVVSLDDVGMGDVARVGGKNASLGEMRRHLLASGVRVPGGYATTADAYHEFLDIGGLERTIRARLAQLDPDHLPELEATASEIRYAVLTQPLPARLERALTEAWKDVSREGTLSLAVRSSATVEDLADASFAGQQESFLNVQGLPAFLDAVKRVFASLFNDRAIAYRLHQKVGFADLSLSVGIQPMIRSDLGASGVLFTIDTESGFRDVMVASAAWGLGEAVVQGSVNPDEYILFKPALAEGRPPVLSRRLGDKTEKVIYDRDRGTRTVPATADEQHQFVLDDTRLVELGRMALAIETHYARPMDIEWAIDGQDGLLYIVQSRPETVVSRAHGSQRYVLDGTPSRVLVRGRAVGARIGHGVVRVVAGHLDMDRVADGDVLVTTMTEPGWEPVMRRAAAIVTDRGGRTCHAAIIARELGIPAVIGCGDATAILQDGTPVTVNCADGQVGTVHEGLLAYHIEQAELEPTTGLPVKIMLNVGDPERAFGLRQIPNDGIGLARLEFLIAHSIGIHPQAALDWKNLPPELSQALLQRAAGYPDPVAFYITKLTEGIATLAAAFTPKPVIVRCSDFKSNEYAHLLGGDRYEPIEENPMLGFRGASRYVSPSFAGAFALECEAIRRVRHDMGFRNVEVMMPFVRTPEEARQALAVLAANGLRRGDDGLRVIMMCELPANAILADEFLAPFDGFSIGSNDLTQLTLGLDRDSELVADLFDERNPAVRAFLALAIQAAKRVGKYVGICGQGPSDHPDLARWLVDQGIDSLSLNPDAIAQVIAALKAREPTIPQETSGAL